jgi:DNA-binding response OmpR family regulator
VATRPPLSFPERSVCSSWTTNKRSATPFRSLGHVVDVASSGAEGLSRARNATYDVMLLDLRLPDSTGDAILRTLQKEGRAPARVVFVTGDTQSAAARAVLEATGCDVVGKPFLFDELAAVVLTAETS